MVYPIKMNTMNDAIKVSEVAAEAGIDMSVSSGSAMIDPRSLLGLFAFIGKDAVLVAPDDLNPHYFMRIIKKIGVAIK